MKFERHDWINQQHLRNETILLGDSGALSIVGCTLENCVIVLDSVQTSRIYDSRLSNCTIEARRRMKNATFFSNDFLGCTFRGKFFGVDFGRRPWPNEATKELDELGEVVGCDFRESVLDLCRFFSVNINGQRFATWPQFALEAHRERAAYQLMRPWPGDFGRYLELAKDQPPAITIATGTAKDFTKRYDVTEEELRLSIDAIANQVA